MAKKTKRITINAFEKVMKENFEPEVVFDWHGIEVTVQKVLTLNEMLGFVYDVAQSCFGYGSGVYEPGAKDFAIRTKVLEKYANFTMPASIELQYDLLYRTDAFTAVLNYIDSEQFRVIIDAIDEKIDYMKQANIFAFKKQVNSFTSALENFEKQMEQFSAEDVSGLINALSNSKIDEGKLVEAYIKQNRKLNKSI